MTRDEIDRTVALATISAYLKGLNAGRLAEREECDKELTASMARERAVARQAIRSENKLKEIENYYLLYKDDDIDAEKALQRISEVIYETDYLFSRGQDGLR